MHLSKLAVRRPVTITVFVIIALMFGVISLQRIGIDLLPDMNFPIAVVVTVYPGGPATTVEQDVTIPLKARWLVSAASGAKTLSVWKMSPLLSCSLTGGPICSVLWTRCATVWPKRP